MSTAEMARTMERMEVYDSLNELERALVQEYGFAKAYDAIRRFYGRPAEARKHLEAQRKAALPITHGKRIR